MIAFTDVSNEKEHYQYMKDFLRLSQEDQDRILDSMTQYLSKYAEDDRTRQLKGLEQVPLIFESQKKIRKPRRRV